MRYAILALPRSRTAWLSAWLTTETGKCWHEPIADCSQLSDLDGLDGVSDTSALLAWNRIYKRWPDAKYVIVKRDPHDVTVSLRKLGLDTNVNRWSRVLRRAADSLPALVIEFPDMDDRLREIWEWVKPEPFDAARAYAFSRMNITADPQALLSRVDPARMRNVLEV